MTRRRLVLRAALLIAIAAVAARLLPLGAARRLLIRLAGPASGTPGEVAAAVGAAGRLLRVGCLPRALAAEALLPGSRLRLGVAAPPFRAHAWVELGGRVVLGGPAAPYAPIV